MLTVGSLDEDALQQRLGDEGASLTTGPFRFHVTSSCPAVVRGLRRLYGEFTLEPTGGFHDFHVAVHPVPGTRRWLRPQVRFEFDGQVPFKPLPAAQAFALLEWGMNWCVAGQAHHYLLLHAAALERGGKAVVLPGEPGAGKSTLTAALMINGWRLLSDELTVVDPGDGLLRAVARPVSLKNRSIDVVRSLAPHAVLGEIASDTHKGTVSHLRPSEDSVRRMHEPARAAHIVFPRWREGVVTTLRSRGKADAFMHTASHAFNYSLLGRRGFDLNAALVDACDCWDFEYSRLDEALRIFEGLAS